VCFAVQMGIWLLDRVNRSLNLSLLKRFLSKVNRVFAFYLKNTAFDIEIKGLTDGGQKLQSPRYNKLLSKSQLAKCLG
jgi:hypothetical protein